MNPEPSIQDLREDYLNSIARAHGSPDRGFCPSSGSGNVLPPGHSWKPHRPPEGPNPPRKRAPGPAASILASYLS